jgi:hypothetical protein
METTQQDVQKTNRVHGRTRIWWLVGGLLLLSLLIIGGVWGLPRLLGRDNTALAAMMPADTAVFLEIDALQLANAETAQVRQQIAAALPLAAHADPTSSTALLEAATNPLLSPVGLTFAEDIQPWIGPNMSIALLPGNLLPGNLLPGDGEPVWLAAATIRNDSAADAFVQELISASPALAATRVDNVLLIAPDTAVIQAAIQAQEGANLAESANYQQLLSELPSQRAATLYLDVPQLAQWTANMPETEAGIAQAIQGMLPNYTAVGLAAYAIANGIQVDGVGLHNGLTDAQLAWLQAQTAVPQTDIYLPADTVVYGRGQRLGLLWQQLRVHLSGLGYAPADVAESAEILANVLGYHPENDLLANLDGEFAIAETPGGTVLLAQGNAQANLPQRAEQTAVGLSLLGFTTEVGSNGVYRTDDFDDNPLLYFGVQDALLAVGTEDGVATVLQGVERPLAQWPPYQQAIAALPADSRLLFYLHGNPTDWADEPLLPDLPVTAVLGSHSTPETSFATLIIHLPGE